MDNLGVLELQADNINNALYKNTFVKQCKKEYLAIVDSDKITKAQLEHLLETEDMFSCGDVLVFCAGQEQDAVLLNLENVLECFAVQIIALVFRRDLLGSAGNYNYRLAGMTDYEMLCRLTETNGNAIFVFPGVEEDSLCIREQDAFTCAYIIRRYLHELKACGKMAQLLQQMCWAMEQSGVNVCFKGELNKMLQNQEYYERIEVVTAPIFIMRGDDACNGVLQDFADQIAKTVASEGQAYILAEVNKIDYDYLLKRRCKAFVGFQTKAFKLDFFKGLHGPKFQYWFDNPVFYKEHFFELPKDCYVLCHDANYVDYIHKEYDRNNAMLFPPGGHSLTWLGETERPYDIVFIGGHFPEVEVPMDGMDREFCEYMLKHPHMTFADGLKELLAEKGIDWKSCDISEYFTSIKHLFHNIINHYRTKVIETILEAGYDVHVYGDSWDHYQSPNAHHLIRHSVVSVEESIKEWQKAKIGLNVMSWHKAGMTERIANIMLCGAACLSEETSYLKENFAEGEEIVTFQLGQLEELPGKIEQLLRDDNWRRIARNGYEKAICEHTWEQRALQLLDLIEEII